MGYKIGSFNLYKFGNTEKKDLDLIAKIIKNEGFDILAVQEAFSRDAIQSLVGRLNNGSTRWDFRWATPPKSSPTEAEGYAFIWNTDTMELSYSNVVSSISDYYQIVRRPAEPIIFNRYRIDRKEGQFELSRNPYYGRFKPKDCFCELRLINTHIRFGEDEEEHYSRIKKLGQNAQRQNELRILIDSLYRSISDERRYCNYMPSYTVILGDYNLNLNRVWNESPYIPSNAGLDVDVYYIIDNQRIVKRVKTVQETKTTLKRSFDDDIKYANNYDHFSFDQDEFMGVYARASRPNVIDKYCKTQGENKFAYYKANVSDHLPISLNINLNNQGLEWEE